MIHDVLMSLLHPNPEMTNMYKLISTSDAAAPFLHPAEMQMLRKIVDVMENYRKIENYIRSVRSTSLNAELGERSGLYAQAFARGIDESLEEYRKVVIDTEKRFLQNPHNPMSMVYVAVYPFNRVMEYLLRMINGVNDLKLTGCSILKYLHKSQFECVSDNAKTVKIIQKAVLFVFFQQLSQWLVYGRLVDRYEEFFIVRQDTALTFMEQHSKFTVGSMSTIPSREACNFSQHELSYDLLPQFIDRSVADDILFIGQTVIKFNTHDSMLEDDRLEINMKESFWGDFEITFYSYFGSLFSETEKLNVGKFHQIIVDMKKYVTEHLYKIAKKDCDLLHQLKLIKDYYLLGRGDQYEEFIKECRMLSGSNHLALNGRDLNRAYQLAAQSLNIAEDLEQFTFCSVEPGQVNGTQNPVEIFDGSLIHISMHYKVKWPLHMIFSSEVIERYNQIFQFLLRIKKAQHDLQLVWTLHREKKLDKSHKEVQFRNKLMFFIDNMFMYLQVDVIESRFNALISSIRSCEDFLIIQREHSLFQIMVLSHCFLLGSVHDSGEHTKGDKLQDNEVLFNLERILSVVALFTEWQLAGDNAIFDSQVPGMNSMEGISDQFDSLIKDFIIRLMGLKAGPHGMPLTQLLLRLNFNYNFSKSVVQPGSQ